MKRNESRNEKELSEYIDTLNKEKKPREHGLKTISPEQEKLYETVRMVRSLKEPAMPDRDFPQKLARNTVSSLGKKAGGVKSRRRLFINVAAAALVIVAVVLFSFSTMFNNGNIVFAMERAFKEVKAYHGVLEFTGTNAEGQNTTQAKLEVWADKKGRYYVKGLEGSQAGLTTVNNGQKKWQIRPDEKQVYIFTVFPDPYRFVFELGEEIHEVKNALKYEVKGEESVSGREASVLEVHPRGGLPYKLWIDKETDLPLKKQSSMQNALQYTVMYTEIEFIDAIPAEHIAYSVPSGFTEVDTNPEQIVLNPVEAQEIAGFEPKAPENVPEGFYSESIAVEVKTKTVKLNYATKDKKNRVVILETKTEKEFKPASTAALGKVGDSTAEFQSPVNEASGIIGGPYAGMYGINSIRWQKDGFEYAVVGNASVDVLAEFVEGLGHGEVEAPEKQKIEGIPQVEVPVDMEVEENEQKSVDGGHSPWRLDPVYVAQVFVSLKISPDGIQGEYPVEYGQLKVIKNTGKEAVIEVVGVDAPVRKVYLKKLVRQDDTGIWTVVGYDPE